MTVHLLPFSNPQAQSLFLSLGGVKILLPYFQANSKFQVMSLAVVDIFVLVSSDSGMTVIVE